MLRIVIAILTGLVGAALLHLIIILSLPRFTGHDAYTRILGLGQANRFIALKGQGEAASLGNGDPYLRVAVCSFDVTRMPTRLMAQGDVPFWSVSVFDAAANEVFSMNDRTSVGGVLDVVLATPVQLTGLRKALPEALDQSILVELPSSEGYAVLRTLSPRASFDAAATEFLNSASCAELGKAS